MSQYLIFYKHDEFGEVRIGHETADDDPQLLHKLGDRNVLDEVRLIYEVRPVTFDIAYYQD